MAKGDLLGDTEEVVRAAMHPYWDADLHRASPSAFTQEEVSVSRLAVLSRDQIVSIFEQDFGSRVDSEGVAKKVRGIGTANVGDIVRQAEEPLLVNFPDLVLTVIEDRIEDEPGYANNPAHALICGHSRT
ncbi:hypothetical protein [Candidimonas nitroreducens]|uniref:hypothetical protein n=1 Tax=Candidimonas nitroreducens TaxID=683354 RepID=UPI0011780E95|nr:hypothetical protein [Candidimonas nitroreducens]